MAERSEDDRRGRTIDLKRLQDLGLEAAAAARNLADDFAKSIAARTPEPMVRIGEQITNLSTLWVGPIQELLNEQREFFEVMSAWAAHQREFADQMNKLAANNQKMSEQLTALLAPMIDQAEAARERARPKPTPPAAT